MIITVTANPAVDVVYGLGGGVLADGLNRAVESEIFAGGKGINVSRSVIREGGCVKTVCLFGGSVGRLLVEKLDGEGIAVFGVPTACETRVNVCAVSPDGDACEINAPGGPVTLAELDALTDAIVKIVEKNDIVVLAGSLPKVSDGDGAGYWASLIPKLKGKGGFVILDCSGEAMRRAVFGENPPDLIKPNLDELCELLGIDRNVLSASSDNEHDRAEILFKTTENASRGLAENGISVLVTLGELGSVFTDAKNPREHIRQGISTVSRVTNIKGAGDTFLGTFAHRYFILKNDAKNSIAAAAQAAADHVAGK